jgi:pyrophosphate--fructose-6-phosphate 1-phosphotransferase
MSDTVSALQEARSQYQPKLPAALAENGANVAAVDGDVLNPDTDVDKLKELFPTTCGLPIVSFAAGEPSCKQAIKVGVILSGGQAPGGHNVIAGIFDGLKALNPDNVLYGFLGGPSGLIDNKFIEITADFLQAYRNTGGFDIIGSGRTKLEEQDDFDKVAANCKELGVEALVVVGGDDSNTNACVLAEYYKGKGVGINVVGCPKTIDGDLKNEYIEVSFGFDTATKVYGELIGNIERDSNSAKKYWHFIKLMGRSASHIALECALQTQPSYTVISEEVAEKKKTLRQIVEEVALIVKNRADAGQNFGVVLIPEGLIEFIPEMKALISELNDLLAGNTDYFNSLSDDDKLQYVNSKSSAASSQAFGSLPGSIQRQLLMDRDPHGNVQVSRIETEKLIIDLVGDLLREWSAKGTYKGKFSTQSHFFGYEGRCAAPSNFDADYCYSLGYTAAGLLGAHKTGYIASVRNLTKPASEWVAGGIPITAMMNMERRHGEDKPVIRKALVELDGKPFKTFADQRHNWAVNNCFVFPGPIQYFGPTEVCDRTTKTIQLERE